MLHGKIVRAGARLQIGEEQLTGFFIETTGAEIMQIEKQNLFNQEVFVGRERRRGPRAEFIPFDKHAANGNAFRQENG